MALGVWLKDSLENDQHIPETEYTYIRQELKRNHEEISKFYMSLNIHKDFCKFCPIVAICCTALLILSIWLNYILNQLLQFILAYIKDRNKLRRKMKKLTHLLNNARLVVADAVISNS